ncbi:hypothetical protein RB195_015102 [Necator americanus]
MAVYTVTALIMWFRDWQNVSKLEGSCVLDPSLRYQRKMIRTLSVFISVFFCSGFASAIMILSSKLMLHSDSEAVVESYATIPAVISCSQNFYVYNVTSKDFRKAFKKNFNTLWKWKNTKFSRTNPLFQITMSGRKSAVNVITMNTNS